MKRLADLPVLDAAAAQKMAEESDRLVEQIGPILHGHDPRLQASVLADLVSMWLAGVQTENPNNADEWAAALAARELMFTEWIAVVRKLVEPNEQIIAIRSDRPQPPRKQ